MMSNISDYQNQYGQLDKVFSSKDTPVYDENGKVFNSMIDALNYMSNHGYEFVQAYAFDTRRNSSAESSGNIHLVVNPPI